MQCVCVCVCVCVNDSIDINITRNSQNWIISDVSLSTMDINDSESVNLVVVINNLRIITENFISYLYWTVNDLTTTVILLQMCILIMINVIHL